VKLSYRNKYIIIFLIITITTIGIILFLTANKKTLEALITLKLTDLFYLLLLWLISLLFDGLSIYFLVKASDENITAYTSLQTSAIKYFFNMITPFSFGGQPVMVYYLSQQNISTGKSSSIVMTKLLLMSIWAFLGAAVAFYFNSELITSNLTVLIIFVVTGFLQTLFVLSIIFIMLFPHLFLKFFLFAGKLGQRFKLLKKTRKLKRNLIIEGAAVRRSFKHYFKKHFLFFSIGIISNGISYLALLTMLYFVFHSFGYTIPLSHAMAFTALLFLIMGFFPTPGASGFAEGLFLLMVSKSTPVAILGISVLIWRFFTHYLSMIVGMVFSIHHLSGFILDKKK